MKTVRVQFKKYGPAKFISHLDLMRFMSRVLRRTKLPVWYTEGFNPRVYLTFAQPLSLGFESSCEIMEFRLAKDDFPLDEIERILSEHMPAGLVIRSVCEPAGKLKDICFARYEVWFTMEGRSPEEAAAAMESLLCDPWIEVEKKSKSGMKMVDIKPMIRSFEVTPEGSQAKLAVTVQSGAQGGLNPSLILAALQKETGCPVEQERVHKTDLYDAEMNLFL